MEGRESGSLEVGFFLLISKRTSTGYLHDVVTCRSRRWLVVVDIYRGREAARYSVLCNRFHYFPAIPPKPALFRSFSTVNR